MAHWTSKNAILRDLSLAQGREVPVELENTVGFNEKPPALNYTEDTEEEFYSSCAGGGDFNSGPDLDLIQQMLDMVREVDVAEIDNKDTKSETIIEISKINISPQSVQQDSSVKNNDIKCKKKKKRNVAMDSLFATYGYTFTNKNNDEENNVNTVIKDNNITSNSMPRCQNQKITSPLAIMFKKKSPNKNIDKIEENDSVNEIDCTNLEPAKFVPSAFAGETYKKYLEMSKIQERVKEDIWSKVEKKMKEIDELKSINRKRTGSLSPTTSNQDTCNSELKGMDFVRLPQHRHLLTGECKVCQVLCVHSKEEIERNSDK